MPRVSVIIATHSRPHLLPRAVESARRAGSSVEVVVVDDASDDSTAQVCRSLDDIVYVRLERNQRVAGARNVGIAASTGEFISFHDDDDLRVEGSLDVQLAVFTERPEVGLVYGQATFIDEAGNPLPGEAEPSVPIEGDVFWRLLEGNFIHCVTAIFRRACLYRVGLLEKSCERFDDWDLFLRIAELYPVAMVRQPVAMWRVATPLSGQGSSNIAEAFSRISSAHQNRWLSFPRAAVAPQSRRDEVRRRLRNRMSDTLIWNAAHILEGGHYPAARDNILTALRLNPRRAFRPWSLKILLAAWLGCLRSAH
jgi:glycosyltransferase involved in cell wall biosynthesis